MLIGLGESISVFMETRFRITHPKRLGYPMAIWLRQLLRDPQGRVWLGTSGGCVYLFDGEAGNTRIKSKIAAQYKLQTTR